MAENKVFILSTETPIPTLYVHGYIGKGEAVDLDIVRNILKTVPGGELTLDIHSGGGSIIEGFAIYDLLKMSGLKINTIITGIAGSMGGVLALAGDKISMYPHARYMTHRPKLGVFGEPDHVESQANLARDMEKQAKALLKTKTGQEDSVIDSWFKSGVDTWFNAEEALAANIADEIIVGVQAFSNDEMPKVNSELELYNFYNQLLNHTDMNKVNITLSADAANKIGVSANTDTETIVNKATELAEANAKLTADNAQLKADLDTKNTAEVAMKTKAATALVEAAIKDGKIDAKVKETFIKQATENYDDIKAMFDGIVARKPISQQINTASTKVTASTNTEDNADWTYKMWSQKDPKGLAEMRDNDPEAFEALRVSK